MESGSGFATLQGTAGSSLLDSCRFALSAAHACGRQANLYARDRPASPLGTIIWEAA